MCTAVLIGWDPATPPPLRIGSRIRVRYWSAKIDDISLWLPVYYCQVKVACLIMTHPNNEQLKVFIPNLHLLDFQKRIEERIYNTIHISKTKNQCCTTAKSELRLRPRLCPAPAPATKPSPTWTWVYLPKKNFSLLFNKCKKLKLKNYLFLHSEATMNFFYNMSSNLR